MRWRKRRQRWGEAGKAGKYTRCRAYGPYGTSKDDKGRRYTKINCKTRKPL